MKHIEHDKFRQFQVIVPLLFVAVHAKQQYYNQRIHRYADIIYYAGF